MEVALAVIAGLLLGSFLNVCIHRWPRDLSIVYPSRSMCPRCGHAIAAWHNLPVVSWLMLGGRCAACRTRIPWRYPVVEALTAALFAAAVIKWGPTAMGAKFAVFFFLHVGMMFSDLETRLLPDEFTKGGIVLGVLLTIAAPFQGSLLRGLLMVRDSPILSALESAFAAAFVAGALWFIGWGYGKLRHRDGLGFGDVKMVGMIGAFLGLQEAFLAITLAGVLSSVIGVGYVYLTKKDFATYELPFGTFLGAAAIVVSLAS